MAKKEHSDIISSFAELKEFKNIDNSTMLSILEEAFRKVISNIYGSDQNYDFIFNPDKGDFEIWRNRIVVEDDKVEDPHLEISLSDARKIADDYEFLSEPFRRSPFFPSTISDLPTRPEP